MALSCLSMTPANALICLYIDVDSSGNSSTEYILGPLKYVINLKQLYQKLISLLYKVSQKCTALMQVVHGGLPVYMF